MKFSFDTIALDRSTDGGLTWTNVSVVASNIAATPGQFANTTFRDGIENSFATGTTLVNGRYPLYVAWEDYSVGVDNVLLTASYDAGASFQPNLAVSASGTVSVNFYDRRLPCPAAGTVEAMNAGLALEVVPVRSA